MGGKKILVVDDDPGVQLLLKRRLEAEGYDIVQAEDGEQGLKRVIEDKPDFILTDVVMPKMSGIEFFKKLRALKVGAKIPVIVISRRALMKDCFEEGSIVDFFAKPFDMNALIGKIAAFFDKQNLLNDLAEMKGKERETFRSAHHEKSVASGHEIYVCKKCGKKMIEKVGTCSRCGGCEFLAEAFYV